MGQYADLQSEAQEALEQRQGRRRRLERGVRGLLREYHRPRWLAGRCLLWALPWAVLTAWLAFKAGLRVWGFAPALGVLVLWLEYVRLLRAAGERLAGANDFLTHLEDGVAFDDIVELRRSRRVWEARENREHRYCGSHGSGSGGGGNGGGGGFPDIFFLMLIGLTTLGVFLVWEIIQAAPSLLTGLMIDEPIARQHPGLERRVALNDSPRKVGFDSSAPYFYCLAVVVLMIGLLLSLYHTAFQQRARARAAEVTPAVARYQ